MKKQPIPYERSVTFGRFNIPHSGHVELIQLMLEHSEEAHVYLSEGGSNNELALRELLLAHLCRAAKVDLKRVYFLKATSPFTAVEKTIESSPWQEAVIVLGSDQQDFARSLGNHFDCPVIINSRSNSSTQMRYFLDAEVFREDLIDLYGGDEYATTLAMILRKEERSREKHPKAARKAGQNTEAYASSSSAAKSRSSLG